MASISQTGGRCNGTTKRERSKKGGINLQRRKRGNCKGNADTIRGPKDERKGTSFAVDYTQQITPRIRENKRFLDRMEKAVQKIEDPLEREVLQMRYMDGNACRLTGWKEVAFQLYKDDSAANVTAAHRLHRKALHTLAAILESEGANE